MSIQKSRIYEDFTKINRVLDDAEKEHATAADLQRRKAACFDWEEAHPQVECGFVAGAWHVWIMDQDGAQYLAGGNRLLGAPQFTTRLDAVEAAMAKEREGK